MCGKRLPLRPAEREPRKSTAILARWCSNITASPRFDARFGNLARGDPRFLSGTAAREDFYTTTLHPFPPPPLTWKLEGGGVGSKWTGGVFYGKGWVFSRIRQRRCGQSSSPTESCFQNNKVKFIIPRLEKLSCVIGRCPIVHFKVRNYTFRKQSY